MLLFVNRVFFSFAYGVGISSFSFFGLLNIFFVLFGLFFILIFFVSVFVFVFVYVMLIKFLYVI